MARHARRPASVGVGGVREVLQVCPLFIATSKLGMYCTAAWPVPLSSHWPSSLRQYTLARWRASAPLSPMLAHPALGPGARAAACCSAEPQRPRAKRALATAAKAHKRQTDVAPFPYPPRRSPLLLHASSQLICGRARRSTACTFCYAMPAFSLSPCAETEIIGSHDDRVEPPGLVEI